MSAAFLYFFSILTSSLLKIEIVASFTLVYLFPKRSARRWSFPPPDCFLAPIPRMYSIDPK